VLRWTASYLRVELPAEADAAAADGSQALQAEVLLLLQPVVDGLLHRSSAVRTEAGT
jgi:hypothetical protein